jgi:C-terminal processing protease CtpA/Prc
MRDLTPRLAAMLLLLVIVSVAGGGCVVTKPPKPVIIVPDSNLRLPVLEDAYYQIRNNYVDPASPDKLSASAIRGMEDYAMVKKITLAKPAIGSKEQTITDTEALTKIGETFGLLVGRSDLDPKLLEHAAVKGMIQSLDLQSSFISAEMYKEMQIETKGKFGGIGLQIGQKNNRLTVIAPIEGTPADRAGITLIEAVERLRGPVGAKLHLTLEREKESGALWSTSRLRAFKQKLLRIILLT